MSRLEALNQRLNVMKKDYEQASGRLALLVEQKEEKETEVSFTQNNIEIWEQVQVLFSKVSEFARAQLKKRIEDTVTAGLQAILERDDISFEILITQRNGKPAAEWQVVSKYGETAVKVNPEDAKGGGVTDVVSLALRLSLLELARPKPEGPVVLDEPGKMISREYLPNVASFLRQYAQQTGRQIIMVTHHEPLAEAADVSYRVSQENGISKVVRQ